MTYHITRHARIRLPKTFKPVTVEQTHPELESKGAKRILQKSVGILPISAFGALAGITIAEPSIGAIGLASGTVGYMAVVAGSVATLLAAACPIFKDITTGRRKYLPGKSEPIKKVKTHKSDQDIEPYSEWDNVFLPYAVEAFNGVKVKASDGECEYRKPIKLNTDPYIEFRTATRTTGINPSVVEAQSFK